MAFKYVSHEEEIQPKEQYIVCYDIENSVIYEVYDESADGIQKNPDTIMMRERIATKLGQSDTRYIDRQNIEQAQKILDRFNSAKSGKSYFVLVPLTHKYLSNFYIFNVSTGEITSKFARSPEEDNAIFMEFVQKWKKGADILFTAHNLDYEYSYIRFNTIFLKVLLEQSVQHAIIANGTTDIKSLEFVAGKKIETAKGSFIQNPSKFIIRDSYLMTGKSIKALGNSYGLPKLDYDYEVTRIESDELTEEDYTYNQRDNEIALRAILEIREQNADYDDITRLPMSATQHSRNTCKSNPAVNRPLEVKKKGDPCDLFHQHCQLSAVYNMPTAELFQKFFNASGGGLIGVNPNYTSVWHSGVYSFDISSAHPSQAFNKRFPLGIKTVQLDADEFSQVIEEMQNKSRMLQLRPRTFYNSYNPAYDYLMRVEFVGLRERDIKGNIINSLGSGKVMDMSRESADYHRLATNVGGVTLHGKTRSSKKYIKWFYGIDLIYHLSFYEYDEIRILECYKYPLGNCDEYTISKFEFYGAAKQEYKKLKKLAEHSDFDTVKAAVDAGKYVEEYTKNALRPDDYAEFLANELLRIKAIFNGIFGQEYQNPVHNDMEFTEDFEIAKLQEQDYKECIKKSTVHYCVGAYIAAWSRFELACMLWHIIKKGGHIFYFATDSIKCNGVKPDVFDNWCCNHTTLHYERNAWNFGAVDCENADEPLYFFTPETLKHIDIGKDSRPKVMEELGDRIAIHATVSGFKAGVYLKNILDEWTVRYDEKGKRISDGKAYTPENIEALKKLLEMKMLPQIIPPELTGKLVRDRKYQGARTELGQVNFGALQEIAYNLGGFNSDDNKVFGVGAVCK